MSSHFECLGFPFAPDERPGEALVDLVRRLFDEGEPRPAPEGWHAVRWRGGEGLEAWAAIAMNLEEGTADIQCLTPSFLGTTRHRARVLRVLPDAECPLCDYLHADLLPEGRSRGHPVLLEVKDPEYRREMDLRGAEVVLQVNLLAQKVRAYADRADFAARREEDLEAESFVPTGLVGGGAPRPRADVTGEVLAPRTLVNPLTGREFLHARLKTFGGEFDLLTARDDHPEGLREGQVLQATCSLVGRIVEGIP